MVSRWGRVRGEAREDGKAVLRRGNPLYFTESMFCAIVENTYNTIVSADRGWEKEFVAILFLLT